MAGVQLELFTKFFAIEKWGIKYPVIVRMAKPECPHDQHVRTGRRGISDSSPEDMWRV